MIRVNLTAILAYIVIFCKIASAQFGWTPITTGTVNNLNSVFFTANNTGYIAGDISTILKTNNNGNNWTSLTSPVSTNFTGIYFINQQTGYIVGELGKIIKTTDGGSTWSILNSGLNKHFYDVFFFQGTGWVIGEDGIILKTTDSGNSWNQQVSGTNFILKSAYFLNSQTGFISGAKNGGYPALILKTTNGGDNWSVQLYPSYSSFNDIFFSDLQTGFLAGTGNGANGLSGITFNSGNNWSFPVQNLNYTLNGLYFFNSTLGFAVGETGEIVNTTNSGVNWSYESSGVTASLQDIAYTGTALFAVGKNGTVLKKNYGWLNANLNNIYRPNSGRIWREFMTLSDSLCSGIIDSVFWYVNNQLAGTQHTLYYGFPQGTTFVKLRIKNNQGFEDSASATVTRSIFKIMTDGPIIGGSSLIGDNELYTVATGDAVYKMDINGNILYSLSVGGDILSSCSIGFDTSVFMTSSNSNLYGFNKYGAPLWPCIPLGAPAITTPAVDSIDNMLYVGVLNSNFFAINKVTGSVSWSYFADAPVRASSVISSDRKLVFISSKGTLYGFNLITLKSPPLPGWTLSLNDSVFVSPAIDDLGNFYVGSKSGKLYKIRLNNGSPASIVWQVDLGSPITTSITIDAGRHIFVGTANSKLYCIRETGTIKWSYTSKGAIQSTPAISYYQTIYFGNDAGELIGLDTNKNLKFYYQDSAIISCPLLCQNGSLYLGSLTGRVMAFYDSLEAQTEFRTGVKSVPVWGVFQNNVRRTGIQSGLCTPPITNNNNNNNVVNNFELKQNYPNPFNPETKIGFNIAGTCNVKIRVFDVSGRELYTLLNKKMNKGTYEVTLYSANMSSGVYFYRIEAGDFRETKKMIILK
jgi:photosystem II stability/assembly factor-like uncharacterized protein